MSPRDVQERSRMLVIACGALAHEIVTLKRLNGWDTMTVQCLPAELHNRPERIPGEVRAKLRELGAGYDRVFVAYADCGTGGQLDRVLGEEGVERLPGAHCYEFFAGRGAFAALAEAEPGTFYLTDFLARHFERLILEGLGLNAHPELMQTYFGNYRRLVYLAQVHDDALLEKARRAAERLGLAFEHRVTGYGELATALGEFAGAAAAPGGDVPVGRA
ncbi:MAG: DUF1638 domain-containing protein [Gammaproteobacteria bacterium]|nr:DUF1638 domain-containing protein [Gammaproteobacteria bacterium]